MMEEFAQSAQGTVHAFQIAAGVSTDSIWAGTEYPALVENPNVDQIIYHIVP